METKQEPSRRVEYTPPVVIVMGTVRNDTYGSNITKYIEGKTTYRE
jgi:hypothetical protein